MKSDNRTSADNMCVENCGCIISSHYCNVSDKSLTCSDNISVDGVVGSDICELGLQPDYINNTCSVRFSGNVAPTLLWSKDDVTSRDVSNFTVPNLRVTSTVIVKADEHRNGSQFTCSASMVWPSSNLSSQPMNYLNWTSKSLNQLCVYLGHYVSWMHTQSFFCYNNNCKIL